MHSNLWKDDQKLLNEVTRAVMGTSRKAFFDTEWVKNAVERCDNQDWDDKETRAGNIIDIVELARAELKVKEKRVAKSYQPRKYVSASVDLSYATVDSLEEQIKAIRMKYWGAEEPPFRKDLAGVKAALQWFCNQEGADEKNLGARPGQMEMTFKLKTSDCDASDDAIERAKVHNTYVDSEGCIRPKPNGIARIAKEVAAYAEENPALAFSQIKMSSFRPKSINLPSYKIKDDNYKRHFFANEGQTLGNLRDNITAIVEESGWWQEEDALDTILFGSIPSAAPKVSSKRIINSEDSFPRREISITMLAPATVEEVAKAYADELKYLNLDPTPMTEVQIALARLVAKYPEAPWNERLTIWKRWCRSHPELTKYSDYRGLRRAYISAKEKATRGWGEMPSDAEETSLRTTA